MKFTRVTTNGRVTIPTAIRKKYGLTPGRKIRLEVAEEGITLIPLVTKDEVRAIADSLGMTSLKPGKKGSC